MYKNLSYTEVAGKEDGRDVTVYALSTCVFCKRALAFLEKHNIAHRYIFIDQISFDEKEAVKAFLKERYDRHISFPFVSIDGKESLVGFVESQWTALFLKKD